MATISPLKAVTLTHVPLHRSDRPSATSSRARVAVCGSRVARRQVLTMWSRVYLGYHTVAQVFAGAALGLVLGVSWFWIVNNMLIDYFPAIEESTIGRFLYIRDSSHIPNVLKFEYDNARAARKKSTD
ncbi:lipid phosphate phosphatase gamma, chloroplastic [Asparagus officinalis]|uniref:lipid phosphate phosphatase gamma, chloroplastic n=1 Tax=Asparagus officinalis TaxID=4686 RepID=UPI00098E6A90|nr:lipid phosphate phosphatase gamma, chloroplastic [Asparagus officinalis]